MIGNTCHYQFNNGQACRPTSHESAAKHFACVPFLVRDVVSEREAKHLLTYEGLMVKR